jgi:microcystin-dependent protein
MTPFLGQIMMFAGNFAPRGYAFCNGQLLGISQYSALFSLLGTSYGGNGVSTFALPNLQSRLSPHIGTGPGLSPYVLGQVGGTDSVTISTQTMPAHTHMLNASKTSGSATTIGNTVLPGSPPGTNTLFYVNQGTGPALTSYTMAPGAVSLTGSGQTHTNMMPSLCITFVIALTGIFPSRS